MLNAVQGKDRPNRGRISKLGLVLAPIAVAAVQLLGAAGASAETAAPKWQILSNAAPTNVAYRPPIDQRIVVNVGPEEAGGQAPNVGEFRVEVELGNRKARSPWVSASASAKTVQKALEESKLIGKGNVGVTGGPAGGASWQYIITFEGERAGLDYGQVSVEEEVTFKEQSEVEKAGETVHRPSIQEEETQVGSRATVSYQITPVNIGGAPTVSKPKVVLKDVVPAGLTIAGITETGFKCKQEGAGEREVVCSPSESAFVAYPDTPGFLIAAGTLKQADSILIEAYVDSNVSEGEVLENVATIEGGGAEKAEAKELNTVTSSVAPYGVRTFEAGTTGLSGNPFTVAGGHPYAATTSFFLNTSERISPLEGEDELTSSGGNLKDADVDLPEGFIGNPENVPHCTQAEFTAGLKFGPEAGKTGCPANTQIGVAMTFVGTYQSPPLIVPVYNLLPSKGVAAEFGLSPENLVPIRLDAHVVKLHGRYQVTVLSADTNEALSVYGIWLSLWGVPSDSSHAPVLTHHEKEFESEPAPEEAFLTNPTDCVEEAKNPPTTTLYYDSWEAPAPEGLDGEALLTQPGWLQKTYLSPPVTECGALKFEPSASFQPRSEAGQGTTEVDEPSGYEFKLKIPQDESITGLGTPELRDTSVTLPPGVSLSPGAANGLVACSAASIEVESVEPGHCPDASKIGTVRIHTPLLAEELTGHVYVGEPECSPCTQTEVEEGKLIKLYIEAEGSGVRVKLPGTGRIEVAHGEGRLETTFEENPQTPFDELTLQLEGGPTASLANPPVCGTPASSITLIPWSEREVSQLEREEGVTEGNAKELPFSTPVSWDGNGGACPASLPFNPTLTAATENATAGAYTNFNVVFKREDDREQGFASTVVNTPAGLLGKIAGIPLCTTANAETGNCSGESKIGEAISEAGAGSKGYTVAGPVYLTEGYEGAPFGLAIVVPAKAGPFNLGTVVVRAAITINRTTSALTIKSGSIPQEKDGVPFRIKEIEVSVNRPDFMFNATNCESKTISATLTGAPIKLTEAGPQLNAGELPVSVSKSVPYTASGCSSLPFHPKFTARTDAHGSKKLGASLAVRIEQQPGEADIHKVLLQLPLQLPSRDETLKKACLETVFRENPANCPAASKVGEAVADTPLLSNPLSGPAYLVSFGSAAFPDLIYLLKGKAGTTEAGIEIELVGETLIKNGITYSKFETVPDAPISSFETILPEGEFSLLGEYVKPLNNLCEAASELIAPTTIIGQNNKRFEQKTQISVEGCGPTIRVSKIKVNKGGKLAVTVLLTKAGTVKISGADLKTTRRALPAGSSTVTVTLSKAGRKAAAAHRKIKISALVTAGGASVKTSASVKG